MPRCALRGSGTLQGNPWRRILLFWDKWKNKYTEVGWETTASQVKEELKNELGRWVQALKWHSVQISNTSNIHEWICT